MVTGLIGLSFKLRALRHKRERWYQADQSPQWQAKNHLGIHLSTCTQSNPRTLHRVVPWSLNLSSCILRLPLISTLCLDNSRDIIDIAFLHAITRQLSPAIKAMRELDIFLPSRILKKNC